MPFATPFAFSILRVGLGLTFIGIGYMIWQDPAAWGGFMQPWAQDLLPQTVEQTMKETAVLDLLVGAMLVLGIKTWVAAFMAALHLLVVIVTVGFNDISIRDFGLMAASTALCVAYVPTDLKRKLRLR